MNINLLEDASVASAPAGFASALDFAVGYLETLFTNPVTLNIAIGWGEIDGQAMVPNALGESEAAAYYATPYADLAAALRAEGAPGSASLPDLSPQAGVLAVSSAESKALGLIPQSDAIDGYVGISATLPFSFTPGVAPAAGQYYLVGVIEHEITELMGRVSLLDQQPNYYAVTDLFRFNAGGARDVRTGGAGSTAYFSVDGGATALGTWNNQLGHGDLADWYPNGPAPGGADAFNAFTSAGVLGVVSATDVTLMGALGWTSGASVPPAGPPVDPRGVEIVTQDASVYETRSVSAAALVASVTNPLSDTITRFRFRDSAIGSGTLVLSGVGQAVGAWVEVDAGALASLTFVAGKVTGQDSVLIQAYDATTGAWSATSVAVVATLAPVAVVNTAAWVAANLDSLQAAFDVGGLASIKLTDGGTPTLAIAAAQLASDAGALGKIVTPNTLTTSGVISAAGAASLPTALRARLANPLAVQDSAAAVAASLDGLQALSAAGKLSTITLTDGGAPSLAITAARLATDAGAIGKIVSPFTITATGPIGATAAIRLPSTLAARLTTGLDVVDTAAAVSAALGGLQALAVAGHLSTISLTGGGLPTISVSAALLSADSAALARIATPVSLIVSGSLTAAQAAKLPPSVIANLAGGLTIVDAAASVVASLAALQGLAAAGRIAAITLTNATVPVLSLSAAQAAGAAGALAAITSDYRLSITGASVAAATGFALQPKVTLVAVADSAANVAAGLDGLRSLADGGRLGAVTLTDGGSPVLALTAARVTADAAALLKISSAYSILPSGQVGAAQAAGLPTLLRPKLAAPLQVVDTAAAVVASLDGLQGLAAAGRLGAVALLDSPSPVLTLTAAQLAADATALGKITSPFTLVATGTIGALAAARLPATLAAHLSGGLTIADTAAAVTTNLAGLQTLAAGGRLASIVVSDPGTPILAVTATQLSLDAKALSAIAGPVVLSVTGTLTASQATKLPAGLLAELAQGLAVADTAAGVVGNLAGLQTLAAGGFLASIALTNVGTPVLALTATQLASGSVALAKIVSTFAVSASGRASAFDGDTVPGFSVPGSVLDITDLNPALAVGAIAENAAGTAALLTLTDGVHTSHVTLFGQFLAAGTSGSAASAGLAAAADGLGGTRLTYTPTLTAPHSLRFTTA